jgi:subtilisin family serine protease
LLTPFGRVADGRVKEMLKHQLNIVVHDEQKQPIEDVTIAARPEAIGETSKAAYDLNRKVYYFDALRPGFYTISVEHKDYERQTRRVQVHPKPTEITFILRPCGTPYTYRGEVLVPYGPYEDLIGIILSLAQIPDADKKLNDLFDIFGLKLVPIQAKADQPGDLSALLSTRAKILLRSSLFKDNNEDLKALRESPLIEAAGPIFHLSPTAMSVITAQIMVRFRLEVSASERNEILAKERLKIVREMLSAPNLILVEAANTTGTEISQIASRLLDTGRVIYAEPNQAHYALPDSITPSDFLWLGCWDRQRVGVQHAWQQLHDHIGPDAQFGLPSVIIAVIDNGIKSEGGHVENPDFQGELTDNQCKVYKLFDFARMIDGNDLPLEPEPHHGVACASIASAMASTPSTSADNNNIGVVGVAPNTKLMGLIWNISEAVIADMFVWAAGLIARHNDCHFPGQITPGADITTCSQGLGRGAPLSGVARDMFDHITNRGRNGRGCIAIFSAGNDSEDIEYNRPYGSYERSFSCAASILTENDDEIRASYSGFGKVAWCAPSSNRKVERVHNPPRQYAVWAAHLLGGGNIPSFPEFSTKLKGEARANSQEIHVEDVTYFMRDSDLLIGRPGSPNSELASVRTIVHEKNQVVLRQRLSKRHDPGEDVITGPKHHINTFGGTSAATPLSAGICALVLSANPNLTWVEARQILRDTAIKIDPDNTNSIAQWLDENGDPVAYSGKPPVFSKGYGYGRLDAGRAVSAALCYKFTRDLMIRKNLGDTGASECYPSLDSPDIWVRNMDPAIDHHALPVGYFQPGPHQNPSRSTKRWVYARIKNRGVEGSLDAWVRFYIASSDGKLFVYPENWEPVNGRGNETIHRWNRGTYLIGEVALPGIGPSADFIVNLPWPDELVPPPFTPLGEPWKPHLLVEIVPHDGLLNGKYSHENNNLAEKAILITD